MDKKALIISISAFWFLLFPLKTEGATLNFSPSSGSHSPGASFSAGIYVSSADQAMNGVSGSVLFPVDKLEVVSVSKTGSIISLWVSEPSYSNTAGNVNFEGIVLNPGFSGSSGKILTITFRAKKLPGTTELKFSSGSVLANDGKGTNILSSLGKAEFYIGEQSELTPMPTTPSVSGSPAAPAITSDTHPDTGKWYGNEKARFSWSVPGDVTALRLSANKIPTAVPSVAYTPPIRTKELSNLENGTWYLHAQFKNSVGWGEIAHFRFRVDDAKPESFEILEVKRIDETDPRPEFIFRASDGISGIQYYSVQIDNGEPKIWRDNGSHIYAAEPVSHGKHILVGKAFDGAGNTITNSIEFSVKPLNSPRVTDWTEKIQSGEELMIKGKTDYPNSEVRVYLQSKRGGEKIVQSVRTDDSGDFTLLYGEDLANGGYSFRIEVADSRGAKSGLSEEHAFMVQLPRLIQISTGALTVLAIVVPLIALILILLYLLWMGWHKFYTFKKKIKRELIITERAMQKTFHMLRNSVKEQVRAVERAKDMRSLTKEEENVLRKLKKDLEEAESFVDREIDKIEKNS